VNLPPIGGDRLAALSIETFVERVASAAPAPGAGPVGAFTLAMGIACARKAIAITVRHQPDAAALKAADAQLLKISLAASEGADRDALLFRDLLHAQQIPRDQLGRAAAVRGAATAVARVAERLIQAGEEANGIVLALRDRIHPAMTADIAAAIRLIEANRLIQGDNLAEARRILAE
jgi:formiminotetrahydrofolate cyclodeaminase